MVSKIKKGEIEGISLDTYIQKLETAILKNDISLLEPEFMSEEPDAFLSLRWNLSLGHIKNFAEAINNEKDVEVLAPPRLINLEHFIGAQESLVKKLGTIL